MDNPMKSMLTLTLFLTLLLAGCQPEPAPTDDTSPRMGMGQGMGAGTMDRHRAQIPEPFAGMANPGAAAADALANGGDLYTLHCTSCHGDGGMGDGPAGLVLDPPAAPIAHTSLMVGDDYMFWRIQEGGIPFGTAMPAWKGTLSEAETWNVISYIQALGKGEVPPRGGQGAAQDPEAQAAQHADMLAQALEQNLITQQEADNFLQVHDALDAYLADNPGTGNAQTRQAASLAALVDAGTLTQTQADTFLDVHERLLAAGLMQ